MAYDVAHDQKSKMVESNLRYRFSGHQTFPFRYAWLPKAVRRLEVDGQLFFCDEAMVTLGVGKNMVSSIRHWVEALKLAALDGRKKTGGPSILGNKLFGKNGWDPYLEDAGTPWLLHWQLVHAPENAATWHLAFTKWNRDVFTRAELLNWLVGVAQNLGDKKTSRNSLRRDVDVFIRTYVPSRPDKRRSLEESFDCPLVELGLIRELEDGYYQFVRGPKPTLPVEIFAFALMKFWREQAEAQETISFESLLYGPGSPGAAFKLTEGALARYLEGLPGWTDLHYDETAGLRLLIRTSGKRLLEPIECLENYYESRQEAVV